MIHTLFLPQKQSSRPRPCFVISPVQFFPPHEASLNLEDCLFLASQRTLSKNWLPFPSVRGTAMDDSQKGLLTPDAMTSFFGPPLLERGLVKRQDTARRYTALRKRLQK